MERQGYSGARPSSHPTQSLRCVSGTERPLQSASSWTAQHGPVILVDRHHEEQKHHSVKFYLVPILPNRLSEMYVVLRYWVLSCLFSRGKPKEVSGLHPLQIHLCKTFDCQLSFPLNQKDVFVCKLRIIIPAISSSQNYFRAQVR